MNFTQKSHEEVRRLLGSANVVVDATVGAGFDALFACSILTDGGKVFCFDVQSDAIERSKLLLRENSCLHKACFFETGHENMESVLPKEILGKVDCFFFNLGWLPRSDKKVATRPETTVKALESAFRIANKSKSIVSVLCYKGHTGAMEEFYAVEKFLLESEFTLERFTDASNKVSPELFVVKIGDVKK